MSEPVLVQSLFSDLHKQLSLEWIAGLSGEKRAITPGEHEGGPATVVGRLNLIHPLPVQVLGRSELRYIEKLGKNSAADAIKSLFCPTTVLVVVGNDETAPEILIRQAEASGTALLRSRLGSDELLTNLQYYLSRLLAEKITLHGVFMEIMGIGVLLTGDPGTGKSELALELITRGQRLIADDAPEFARIAPDIIRGSCPELLRDFLEVRGLGLLNVRAMYGDSAIKRGKYLRLIIHLQSMDEEQLKQLDRLTGCRRNCEILGLEIPEITLPVAPGRNLAVLAEAAVRNHVLSLNGYDATTQFISRQQRQIAQESS